MNKGSTAFVAGVILVGAVTLFAYLMWYVSPAEVVERVKVVAVTEDGCVAETMDGYPVHLGDCQAQPGDFIDAPVDQKTKERQDLMNPTT